MWGSLVNQDNGCGKVVVGQSEEDPKYNSYGDWDSEVEGTKIEYDNGKSGALKFFPQLEKYVEVKTLRHYC